MIAELTISIGFLSLVGGLVFAYSSIVRKLRGQIAIYQTEIEQKNNALGEKAGLLDEAQLLLNDAKQKQSEAASRECEASKREKQFRDAEHKLKQNEERMRRIVDAAYDAFVVFDTRGKITAFSQRACELFGTTETDAIGKSIRAFLEYDHIINDLSQGRPKDSNNVASCGVVESIAKHSDGKQIPVEVSLSMSRFEGRPEFHAFIHDMTNRKAIQSRMMHLEKMESIGKLSAGLAHEINTPMQFIGDNVFFLQGAINDILPILRETQSLIEDLDPALYPAVERIQKELDRIDIDFLADNLPDAIESSVQGLKRISAITSAMKDFANPGAESKSTVDLNNLLTNVLTVGKHNWEKVADLDVQLDPCGAYVDCLPGELSQVILSLIVNAADAISELVERQERDRGRITVRSEFKEDNAIIEIEDNGTGIPESIRNKIFDPFFTTRDVGKGTGQGLAVAHNVIVEQHQGSIHFESEVGRGTCFRVTLPRSCKV